MYYCDTQSQNIQDWVLVLGVSVLVTVDVFLLILNIVISKAMGQYQAVLVPNKDQIRTVSGVTIQKLLMTMST